MQKEFQMKKPEVWESVECSGRSRRSGWPQYCKSYPNVHSWMPGASFLCILVWIFAISMRYFYNGKQQKYSHWEKENSKLLYFWLPSAISIISVPFLKSTYSNFLSKIQSHLLLYALMGGLSSEKCVHKSLLGIGLF